MPNQKTSYENDDIVISTDGDSETLTFFLVVVFLAVVFFAAAFFGLVFLVDAFLASGDNLYDALTCTRTPDSTPFFKAAFITCFLTVVCTNEVEWGEDRDSVRG